MPQLASRGRSTLKTLGFPGRKGRVLGIKDQAPRPEVRPLKATLLKSVSRREKTKVQEIWNLCALFQDKRERERHLHGVCPAAAPSPDPWNSDHVQCRLSTAGWEHCCLKRVSFYFGVEREGSLSRLYLGVEPQRGSDTDMTADLPRELCSGRAADD